MVSHVHDETTAGPENDEKMDDDIESSAAKERLERHGQILQTSQAESGKRRNSATDSTLSNLFQCLNLVKDSRYFRNEEICTKIESSLTHQMPHSHKPQFPREHDTLQKSVLFVSYLNVDPRHHSNTVSHSPQIKCLAAKSTAQIAYLLSY